MPQLIDVIEIKSGKIKQVGEWALNDPKQLANLGLKLADESQSQGLSDAQSISDAVKKKLNDAAAAKTVEVKPIVQEVEIEPVHELVNPLEDYEDINAAESETPTLVDVNEEIPHTVTGEDLENNPDLIDAGVKEGDKIGMPKEEAKVKPSKDEKPIKRAYNKKAK